jgi:hypothetical protein
LIKLKPYDKLLENGIINEVFKNNETAFVTEPQLQHTIIAINSRVPQDIRDFFISEAYLSKNSYEVFLNNIQKSNFSLLYLNETLDHLSELKNPTKIGVKQFRRELGQLFKIRTICRSKRQYLHLNRKKLADIKAHYSFILSESFFQFVKKSSKKWAYMSNCSIEHQLAELNLFKQNHIQWIQKGDLVVPEKIRVLNLDKQYLATNFESVKLEKSSTLEAFKRNVTLRTLNYLSTSHTFSASSIQNDGIISELKEFSRVFKKSLKFNSKILSLKEIDKLIELGKWQGEAEFKLIYRASRDGFNKFSFHELRYNYSEMLLVVKSSTGHIFGGFTIVDLNKAFKSYPYFTALSDPFLFTLTGNVTGSYLAAFPDHLDRCRSMRVNVSSFSQDIVINYDSNKIFNSFLRLNNRFLFGMTAWSKEAAVNVVGPCLWVNETSATADQFVCTCYFQAVDVEVIERKRQLEMHHFLNCNHNWDMCLNKGK